MINAARATLLSACALLTLSAPLCRAQQATQPASVLPPADPALTSGLPLLVHVKSFRFEGNRSIPTHQLQQAVNDFVGRQLTMEQLEAARQAVTLVYINAGYINSGALLPDQDIDNGVILFHIIEGRLNRINLTHQRPSPPASQPTTRPTFLSRIDALGRSLARPLKDSYLRDRIWRDPDTPLNVVDLRDNLELLRQNPNIRRINAELRPGALPGQSLLDVAVEDANPWQLGLSFNNHRPPSVGAERLELLASNSNLLGYSDVLSFRYGLTEGGIDEPGFAGLDDFSLSYLFPLHPSGTTAELAYDRSDSTVVEEPFADLDIESETVSYALTLRQPLILKPNSELAVSAGLSARRSTTELLGQRISLAPGDEDGQSHVTAIRLGQEYSRRSVRDALALRSTFSFGLDAFGATMHSGDDIPDSQYFAWLGQVQYVRRVGESDTQAILRLTTQLTPDPLLAIEQFAVGGVNTVRGYRENQLVRDNALVANFELRIPILRQSERGVLDLAPFFDLGYGWNTAGDPDDLITSAGLGLLYHPGRRVDAQLYWGIPFKHFDQEDDDPQDWGLHFNLMLWLF